MGRKRYPYLRDVILQVVEQQINTNNPPQTRQTYNRLLKEGYTEKEAKQLIGYVISVEMFNVADKKESFNLSSYIKALDRLPTLPWE
jgi:Zn/Cd-binding protein ZinT